MSDSLDKNKVIKEGWLYREEVVQGSLSTWKKRWHVLTLLRLQCYKNSTVGFSIFFTFLLYLSSL